MRVWERASLAKDGRQVRRCQCQTSLSLPANDAHVYYIVQRNQCIQCNHEQKKKPYIAYFYNNLALLLRKYIKSVTILKSFKKSLI